MYDGKSLMYTSNDYEPLNLPTGLRLQISFKFSLTDSEYLTLTQMNQDLSKYVSYRVYKGTQDVTDYYHLFFDYPDILKHQICSYVPIYVAPRYIEVASASASKVEDGTPLTNPTVNIIEGTLIADHVISVPVQGSIDIVGTAPNFINPNKFQILTSDEQDVTDNYIIYLRYGELTILPKNE